MAPHCKECKYCECSWVDQFLGFMDRALTSGAFSDVDPARRPVDLGGRWLYSRCTSTGDFCELSRMNFDLLEDSCLPEARFFEPKE